MERKDQKVTVHRSWELSHGRVEQDTIDASTTELAGTAREAELIVAGLRTLHAQQEMAKAAKSLMGGAVHKHDDLSDEVLTLLQSIEAPNYIGEPEVRHEDY